MNKEDHYILAFLSRLDVAISDLESRPECQKASDAETSLFFIEQAEIIRRRIDTLIETVGQSGLQNMEK